jgi:hypothetical protein
MYVRVMAGGRHQTCLTHNLLRVTQLHQVGSQASTRRIADPHVFDRVGLPGQHSACSRVPAIDSLGYFDPLRGLEPVNINFPG